MTDTAAAHKTIADRAPAPSARPSALRVAAAALVGAGLVIAAFPTVHLAFPVLLAWVPLLTLARRLGWKGRLVAGWLMGFSYQLVIFRWIDFTLEVMTNLPGWVHVVAWVLFALWHGLMGGVFLALAEPARRAAARRWPGAAPLAVAAVYVSIEALWPFLFPWTLGHAFWQVGPLASMMALTGAPGLSFVVLALSALAADAWSRRRQVAWRPTAVVVGLLLAFSVGWWIRLEAGTPRRTLRVAVLQPNYTLAEKRRPSVQTRSKLLVRFEGMLRALPPGRFDLVVAPEGAFPFYWDTADGPQGGLSKVATRRVGAAVREGPAAPVLLGGLRQPASDGRTRNAAVLLGADGAVAHVYDKRILVPFGEYLPLTDVFPSLAGAVRGISDFGRGEAPCQLQAAGEPLSCGICYESIFAAPTRAAMGDGVLLANLTIDTWFGDSTAPWFHLMVQSSRAAELGVPLVRAALTGMSAVVGPDGVPRQTLALHEQGVIEAEVPLLDVTTPYRVVGPAFTWVAFAAAAAVLFQALRRRREPDAEAGVGSSPAAKTG